MGRDQRHEVEEFIFREVDLADRSAFVEWGNLWARDGHYWIPLGDGDYEPLSRLSLVYADHDEIVGRVRRLSGSSAYAQEPMTQVSRVLGNLRMANESEELVRVDSTFILVANRYDEKMVLGGRVRYVVRTGASCELVLKKVLLTDSDSAVRNLTFIL